MQPNRPVATVRPAPAAPIPLWEAHRVFREPQYTDGQPYGEPTPADDTEGQADDGPSDVAA